MRKLTVLLPSEDTEKHILVAVQMSKFTIPDVYTTDIEWKLSQKGTDFTQNWVYLSPVALSEAADKAMYAAKRQGRNLVVSAD